jgi:acyl-CoA reductase-like NAD-dependent aldehyde dehydrogenase
MDEAQREHRTKLIQRIHDLITERDQKLQTAETWQEKRQILVESEETLKPLWNELIDLKD